MSQNNLSWFLIAELPLPDQEIKKNIYWNLILKVAQLSFTGDIFSNAWLQLKSLAPHGFDFHPVRAITQHERLRLRCILDSAVAELYGLSYEDLEWILKDDRTDPKGFWRVDKEKPKELRHTTLTLEAFKHLKEVGLENFLEEDWQFRPEIAAQLGPRFLDWQLEGTPEESWAECEYHARRILGDDGYKKFTEELENPQSPHSKQESLRPEDPDEWKLF